MVRAILLVGSRLVVTARGVAAELYRRRRRGTCRREKHGGVGVYIWAASMGSPSACDDGGGARHAVSRWEKGAGIFGLFVCSRWICYLSDPTVVCGTVIMTSDA